MKTSKKMKKAAAKTTPKTDKKCARLLADNLRRARELAAAGDSKALRAFLDMAGLDWATVMSMAHDLAEVDAAASLKTLMDCGLDLDDRHFPLMHTAAASGAVKAIKVLTPHVDFTELDDDSFTPLALAASEGQMAAVEELLKNREALAMGAGFSAILHCEHHENGLGLQMAKAILEVVDPDVPAYPWERCLLREMATRCDNAPLAALVTDRSSWGVEGALLAAIEAGHLETARGIAGAAATGIRRRRLPGAPMRAEMYAAIADVLKEGLLGQAPYFALNLAKWAGAQLHPATEAPAPATETAPAEAKA